MSRPLTCRDAARTLLGACTKTRTHARLPAIPVPRRMYTNRLYSIHVKNRRTAASFCSTVVVEHHIFSWQRACSCSLLVASPRVCVRLLCRPSQKTARLSRRVKKALGAATSPEAKYHTRPRPANNMCAVRSDSPSKVTTTYLYFSSFSSCWHWASARPLAKQPKWLLSALEDARDFSLRMLEVCAHGMQESGLRLRWDAP